MALIGYRRVSSYDQKLDRQDLGNVDLLFEEKESGSDRTRPALREMLTYVRAGDEVLVWSIDRLARDFRDLQDIVTQITDKGAGIKFLSEGLAFKSGGDDPFAKLQLHMMGAFAEFELALIRKRQADGIAKAKKKGVYKGGKRRIDREKVAALKAQGLGPSAIAKQLGVSRMSVHRVLSEPTAG